jgi:hypothetical protein
MCSKYLSRSPAPCIFGCGLWSPKGFSRSSVPYIFECGPFVPRSAPIGLQGRISPSSAGLSSLEVLLLVFSAVYRLRLWAVCPSKCSSWYSALHMFFECGFLSLEALLLVLSTAYFLRVRAVCPSKRSSWSSASHMFFECGLFVKEICPRGK